MQTRVRFLGHAIHPMLIVFPLGLFSAAVAFDIIYKITDRETFPAAAAYCIAAGLIGSAAAALFGWIDWFSIPSGTRAKRVGLVHGLGNGLVALLFLISWLLRLNADRPWYPSGLAFALALVGVGIAVATSWLGGELVQRMGISVDDAAEPNAASSLPWSSSASTPSGSARTGRRARILPH